MIQVYKSHLKDLLKPNNQFACALSIVTDYNGSPEVKNATIIKQSKFCALDIVRLFN
jgi:hypothetical protein